MAKSKPSRGKDKPRKFKSFSELHGSKSQMNSVGGEQLGHGPQLPVNPPIQGGGSPLLNPGESGHPMGDPGRLGVAMGNSPSGEEFY